MRQLPATVTLKRLKYLVAAALNTIAWAAQASATVLAVPLHSRRVAFQTLHSPEHVVSPRCSQTGCNFMTCAYRGCGKSFCYKCGKAADKTMHTNHFACCR